MKILKRDLTKSEEYWSRGEKIIPEGTQTLSKSPLRFVGGVAPKYLKSGKGCHVVDVDGNEYIDYGMGLRPIILGYSYPAVNEAIINQLQDGITFTLMHPLEVELAELLVEIIPCAEMVRFGKNGSDVTSAAVKVARAYTGREKIVCCGYHGWQDWYIATTEKDKGIPKAVKELSYSFRYNDIENLEKIFNENKGEIAGVIMEPVSVIAPEDNFLEEVKKLVHENGAVLIFDEVITGFRFSLGGAQEYFNVTPDLAAFGKAISNGMPLSALVGKREIMEELREVFFSFCYGGETISLAAALATINEIKEKKIIQYIWKQGKKLQDGYNKLAEEAGLERYTRCIGFPPSTIFTFEDSQGRDSIELMSLFQQEAIKRGILFTGYNAISYSHKDSDIEYTLEVYEDAMKILKKAIEEKNIMKYIEGRLIQPVFKKIYLHMQQ